MTVSTQDAGHQSCVTSNGGGVGRGQGAPRPADALFFTIMSVASTFAQPTFDELDIDKILNSEASLLNREQEVRRLRAPLRYPARAR